MYMQYTSHTYTHICTHTSTDTKANIGIFSVLHIRLNSVHTHTNHITVTAKLSCMPEQNFNVPDSISLKARFD